jgi:hypothetical protein
VVLYGCETWSPILREKHRPRVFENRVLRRMFVPRRDKVIGGWRKLHNEEVHNLYLAPSDVVKDIEICKDYSRHGEEEEFRIPEGNRLLGRPRRRWKHNIKMDLREIKWGGMDCTDVAYNTYNRERLKAVVNMAAKPRVPPSCEILE